MPTTPSTNQYDTASAMRCIGARERCACATSCTICASTVCEPTFSARITRLPLPLSVAPMSFVAGTLLHRHRLAGDHRLVHARAALEHHAIDRHLLARAHAQAVADVHVGELDVLLGAVVLEPPRGLGREAEQRADRGRGLRARAQLEQLAHERERDDHRGGLEIHRRRARAPRSPAGNTPGATVATTLYAIGRGDADADQRPHVGIAGADRCDAALEERPRPPRARPASQARARSSCAWRPPCPAGAVAPHREHEGRER